MEQQDTHVHTEYAVIDIGEDVGALIIYCQPELRGREIEVSPRESAWLRTHTAVLERRASNQPVFAALFLELPVGDYMIWGNSGEPVGEVTISGGEIAEIDWRHLLPGTPSKKGVRHGGPLRGSA